MEKKKTKLFIISGPSGVGKGTLLKSFLDKHSENVRLSISFTTRTAREGEFDGVNYFFTNEEKFKSAIENNEFLEWAKYSDNYYGTKEAYVYKKLSEGYNLILEIDTQGAFQVKNKIKDASLIFIMPPSIDELEKRLRGRKTETEEAIKKRMDFVKGEIENSKDFDYVIINDNLERALDELTSVFEKEAQI